MAATKNFALPVISQGQAAAQNRAADIRLALLLTYITLGWMTVEGGASLFLGWLSKSLLLEAFGIDSVVELFSAAVLLWRLKVEVRGDAGLERVEAVERRAAKLVGSTLYVLAVYVALNSAYGLFISPRLTDTHESAWGIVIGLVAKVGMPILAGYKLRIAARLNSRALRADAMESITCGYLSIVLMVGLAASLAGGGSIAWRPSPSSRSSSKRAGKLSGANAPAVLIARALPVRRPPDPPGRLVLTFWKSPENPRF
jgi:divalent metal cation (Fe/Co/Zn/Cd) transporter